MTKWLRPSDLLLYKKHVLTFVINVWEMGMRIKLRQYVKRDSWSVWSRISSSFRGFCCILKRISFFLEYALCTAWRGNTFSSLFCEEFCLSCLGKVIHFDFCELYRSIHYKLSCFCWTLKPSFFLSFFKVRGEFENIMGKKKSFPIWFLRVVNSVFFFLFFVFFFSVLSCFLSWQVWT